MLLLWFFAGWLAHAALIRLAGWAGNHESLWGLLILPLAVLVRLVSYVGMFLAVRPALTHFERLDALDGERTKWVPTFLSGLIPFLVIYMAWGMIVDDVNAYGRAAADQFAQDTENRPLVITIGVMSISFIVIAFVSRLVIGRLAKRLPAWTGALTAYLEAAWLITAALAISSVLAGVPQWFATLKMFGWAVDGIAALREQFAWFATIGDAFFWLLGAVGSVVLQPLAWLALAAIVFASVLPRRRRSTTGRAARWRETTERRWRRMPRPIRVLGTSLSSGFRERWEPIATALSLIWRNGPLQLGAYILAFAVVTAGAQWLYVLIYTVLGPHESGWWIGMSDQIVLLVTAVSVPLQIVIVAAAFDSSLAQLDEQVTSADAELAEVLPSE
jgi:hypothetical protein